MIELAYGMGLMFAAPSSAKSKKYAKKASANVEAQQWMIQNGVFLVAGLR